MNTVGKPGRLGEHVRCVVSVSMLTEGWDANTVTHILGVRAFGTQLLCEQVVGRGLRRRVLRPRTTMACSTPEYAEVLGVPVLLRRQPRVRGTKAAQARVTRVCALAERELAKSGFRASSATGSSFRAERLTARSSPRTCRLDLTPDDIPTRAENERMVGEGDHVRPGGHRQASPAVGRVLRGRSRCSAAISATTRQPQALPLPAFLRITRALVQRRLSVCKGKTRPQFLMWRHFADTAVERIFRAVTLADPAEERAGAPIIDPLNPAGLDASTSTSRPRRARLDRRRRQVPGQLRGL